MNNDKDPSITKFPSPIKENTLSEDEKIEKIAEKFQDIMEILGLDLEDGSLSNTPNRVAKMYIKEIFSGLDKRNFPKISFIENKYQSGPKPNLVFVKVHFTSFCEHHFVPMNGVAYVAYYPKEKLIGLSKIPRIVKFFARRPQIQERLNAQIAECLAKLLETEDVAVKIIARHFCVSARGIEDQNGMTTTNVFRGKFAVNENCQKEFLSTVEINKN